MISRQYRAISDSGNISEEMGRQFEFLRKDFQELFEKQQRLLEANVDIMNHLRMDPNAIEQFKLSVFKRSMIEVNKDHSTLYAGEMDRKLYLSNLEPDGSHNIPYQY